MKKILIIFSLFAIVACNLQQSEVSYIEDQQEIAPSITNGERAMLGQFPYQVAILMNLGGSTHICGGTLIKHRWVLTAAQCLIETYTNHRVILGSIEPIAGSNVWRSEPISRSDFRMHPQFNRTHITNNIALIFVSDMPSDVLDNQNVGSINLPTEEEAASLNLIGRTGVVSGYGRISDNVSGASGILHYIEQTVVNNSICEAVPTYTFSFRDSNICMNTTGGRSFCGGDSGGPLTIQLNVNRRILVGVVSYTLMACTMETPMFFESVLYHRQWIEDTSNKSSAMITLNSSIFALVIMMILKN